MYKDRIREAYEHLSPGYRRVADFLLHSYRDAAFMTAAEVGKAARVDTTLVVRFAQRLGYPGYPELSGEVQDEVKQDLRAIYMPTAEDNTPAGVLLRALIEDRNNLEYMLLHLDPKLIETVVDLLLRSRRISVMGEGMSQYLAEAFVSELSMLGFNSRVLQSDLVGQASAAVGIETDHVFIGLGMTPLAVNSAVALKVARAKGAHTIGIVADPSNPVAAVAEHVLVAPVRTAGIAPAPTAMAAVLHGLMQALTIRMGDRGVRWVMDTDLLLDTVTEALKDQLPRMREVLELSAPRAKSG